MVKHLDEAWNTFKVAVLEGDPIVKDLLASSFFDNKPVYSLFIVLENVKWLDMPQKCTVKKYLQNLINFCCCPNFVDIYHYDMKSVNREDHLRTVYGLKQDLRQRKWLWSIFLWAFGVAIVNSYLLYKSYLEMHGFELRSHYTYYEDNIFKAWVDTDLQWPTRYQTSKKKARMMLIAESSTVLDWKRTRLGSDSLSSICRMTR